MALILLVRHGQASFGADDYDVLSPTGEQQSRLVGERLRALPRVDRIVHGAMVRQRATAELIAEVLGTDVPLVCDERWDEYDHQELLAGALREPADQERFSAELAAADDPKRLFQRQFAEATARWTAGDHDRDYTEPFPAFLARVHGALDALATELGRDDCAVVATSGGVIAAVCARLLGLDGTAWAGMNHVMVNASVTKLVHGGSGLTLLSVNDHAHFESEHRRLLTYR